MKAESVDSRGLIPHVGPMHLIDEVLWFAKAPIRGEVRARVRAEGPYFGKLGFDDHWLIEICAQASAAVYLLAKRDLYAEPPKGYLVSVREFDILVPGALRAGDVLTIAVDFEVESLPLGQSLCQVKCGEKRIAQGEMSFLLGMEG